MVFSNGVIHSLNENDTKYEWVAMEGVKITAVGIGNPPQPAIDLQGAHVFPGFVDAHAHVYGIGERLTLPRLESAKSKNEVYEILRSITNPPHPQAPSPFGRGGEGSDDRVGLAEWIVSRGWDQNKWQEKNFPTRFDLDNNVSHSRPIALTRIDGHAMWCNSSALQIAGISHLTMCPAGGTIELDAEGQPTGILLDEAMKLVEVHIPRVALESMKDTLRAGLEYFAQMGHIGVHDMGVSAEMWEVYKAVYNEDGNRLLRASVFLDMTKPTGKALFLHKIEKGQFDDSTHPHLRLVGIKLYLDGALGSRGAELFEDYSDEPGNRGLALMDDAEVVDLMQLAARQKLQIAVHAIGDKANARALRLFREAGINGDACTLRIEHAQIVRDADLKEFCDLGVFALTQPAFYTSDKDWALVRIGQARMQTAYRWRSLIDAGIPLVASSDAPIEDPDPVREFQILTSSARPREVLTLDQAIRAYSQRPHELSKETKIAGQIEVGMRADLTVVMPRFDSRFDPSEPQILCTVVDGNVVYGKPETEFAPLQLH